MGCSRRYSIEQARGTVKRTVGVRQRRLQKACLKMPSPDLKLKLFEAVAARETRDSEDYRMICRNRIKSAHFWNAMIVVAGTSSPSNWSIVQRACSSGYQY